MKKLSASSLIGSLGWFCLLLGTICCPTSPSVAASMTAASKWQTTYANDDATARCVDETLSLSFDGHFEWSFACQNDFSRPDFGNENFTAEDVRERMLVGADGLDQNTYSGTYEEKPDRIILECPYAARPVTFYKMDQDAWLFLANEYDLLNIVNRMNADGTRTFSLTNFLSARDLKSRSTAMPPWGHRYEANFLPYEFQKKLLDEPVTGHITQLQTSKKRIIFSFPELASSPSENQSEQWIANARIDLGSDQKVFEGMWLFAGKARMVIRHVETEQASGVIYWEGESIPPAVGSPVRSRAD